MGVPVHDKLRACNCERACTKKAPKMRACVHAYVGPGRGEAAGSHVFGLPPSEAGLSLGELVDIVPDLATPRGCMLHVH